jgi:hypothetical protein
MDMPSKPSLGKTEIHILRKIKTCTKVYLGITSEN